jgi:hypothetical protein
VTSCTPTPSAPTPRSTTRSSRSRTRASGSGPNLLGGGKGNDTITGGPGTDTLAGDRTLQFTDSLQQYPIGGNDTIDSFDGYEDRVDCGGESDTLVADQFDGARTSACESVDTRTADPFGIAPPSPPAQPASTPQGQQPTGGDAPDVRAPVCTQSKTGTRKRADFLRRGVSLTVGCDEPARIEATASVTVSRARAGGVVLSRAGDLVLGERTLDFGTGKRKVAFSVPKSLRKALGKRFTVRIRVDATDRTGNRTTSFAAVKVR